MFHSLWNRSANYIRCLPLSDTSVTSNESFHIISAWHPQSSHTYITNPPLDVQASCPVDWYSTHVSLWSICQFDRGPSVQTMRSQGRISRKVDWLVSVCFLLRVASLHLWCACILCILACTITYCVCPYVQCSSGNLNPR